MSNEERFLLLDRVEEILSGFNEPEESYLGSLARQIKDDCATLRKMPMGPKADKFANKLGKKIQSYSALGTSIENALHGK